MRTALFKDGKMPFWWAKQLRTRGWYQRVYNIVKYRYRDRIQEVRDFFGDEAAEQAIHGVMVKYYIKWDQYGDWYYDTSRDDDLDKVFAVYKSWNY